MSDIANALRDPLWQFAGVIIAIVTVAVLIFLSIHERNRKSIEYNMISSTPVLSISEGVEGKLKILFDEREVNQVQLIVIGVTNTGNVPITEDDYSHPIAISFGKGKLLTVELMEKDPDDLDVLPVNQNDMVVINKVLLNQGDSFTLRALVAQFEDVVEVKGRIAGVQKIEQHVEPRNLRKTSIGIVIAYAGLFGDLASENTLKNALLSVFFIIIMGIGLFISLWYMAREFLIKWKIGKRRK